jgi:hypothetical protein
VELATMHRVLETLGSAINWNIAQTPPLLRKTPFHFGVRLNKKAETSRDRGLSRDEEKPCTAWETLGCSPHRTEASKGVRHGIRSSFDAPTCAGTT